MNFSTKCTLAGTEQSIPPASLALLPTTATRKSAAAPTAVGNNALLAHLRGQLDYLLRESARGGEYPWRMRWALLDAPVCQRGSSGSGGTCAGCPLAALAPTVRNSTDYACYGLAIGDRGETLGELVATGYQQRTERLLEGWLRSRIAELDPRPPALALCGKPREAPAAA